MMNPISWGVRFGSAAFALGLGLGVAGAPGVAQADDTDSSSPAQSSSSGAAGPRATGSSGRVTKAPERGVRAPRRDVNIKPAAAQPEVGASGVEDSPRLPDRSALNPVTPNSVAPNPAAQQPDVLPQAARSVVSVVDEFAARPAAAAGVMSGVLKALGLSGVGEGTGIPSTPMEFISAAVALVRREVEKVLSFAPPAATAQTSETMHTMAAVPAAAAATGTTTTVTWAWGTNPVVNFNPATDTLDFGWMAADRFTVSETGGSTVISVVDNNHTYTLKGVSLSQLKTTNIVAKDAGTVAKWGTLLKGVQTSAPSVSVSDASRTEGNSGTSNMAFTVALSKASTTPVTVKYATANGTATAGQDFTAASGTVTFAPGVTSQVVNVAVTGDSTIEADENFTLRLSSPTGATISRATATGLITNDDIAPPTVSIANVTANEGNTGSTNMGFTVTLSKVSAAPVTVKYATANGTATAGQDYTAASGTVTFAPGVTSQVVNVAVAGDATIESNETFTVALSNVSGATIATATATGTIVNDDVAPTLPSVSIANGSANEGNSGSSNIGFTVTLSKASTTPITVSYATANGTATAGQDYTATSGTITFAPGVVSQIVSVGVAGDTTVEPTETFTVTLSNISGGTISGATAIGSILNDDAGATIPGGTTAQWGNAFFAPYIDMAGWPVPNLLQMSKDTGATLMTLGFLQVDPKGNPAWGGYNVLEPNSTDEQAKAINASIANFRAAGGDVMISFGGAAGTSMAEYYAAKGLSAQGLANAYASVVDTYGVDHIDFDVEGAAIGNRKAVDLNNQALKLLQQARPDVKIWYTLPVLPTGLTADGVYVVESALKAGVNVDGVNVMAMDYGPAAPTSGPNAQTMGTYAIRAAESTYSQMSTLHTKYGKTFGWNQIGVTPMLGVNDIAGEVFTVADAQALENFARTKGIGMLSLWSLERDYPGTIGQATHNASGINAPAGSFSGVFNDYGAINAVNYANTKPSTGTNPVGGGTNSGSDPVTPVTPVSGGPRTTVTWGWGTNPVLNFNPASDTLDFVWMQANQFTVTEKNGSVVIAVIDNNHSYTLQGVTLSQLQLGNIVANDQGTLAKWQALIAAAKAA